jgi:hypothetical protein
MPSVPFKLNQDRRHHIPKQKRKVTNWREYDASSHGAFSRQEDIIGSSEDPRFECPNGVQG